MELTAEQNAAFTPRPSTKMLFVGGVADAETRAVPDGVASFQVAVALPYGRYSQGVYRIEKFYLGETKIVSIAVHEDLSVLEAFGRLLNNYRPEREAADGT